MLRLRQAQRALQPHHRNHRPLARAHAGPVGSAHPTPIPRTPAPCGAFGFGDQVSWGQSRSHRRLGARGALARQLGLPCPLARTGPSRRPTLGERKQDFSLALAEGTQRCRVTALGKGSRCPPCHFLGTTEATESCSDPCVCRRLVETRRRNLYSSRRKWPLSPRRPLCHHGHPA